MQSGLGILAGVALALAVHAPSARAADCANAVAQTDINICAGQARAGADEALNDVYGRLVREPGVADRLDELRAAERAWVVYRDAQCAFEGSQYEGGSMQPMATDDCAKALTERRTAELRKALACTKDGAGC